MKYTAYRLRPIVDETYDVLTKIHGTEEIMRQLRAGEIRPIVPSDEGKLRVEATLYFYRRRMGESFLKKENRSCLVTIDIGKVGDNFVDIYVFSSTRPDLQGIGPMRLARNNPRLFISMKEKNND